MSTKTYTKLPKGLPPLPKIIEGYHWELKGWGWKSEKQVPYSFCQRYGKIWNDSGEGERLPNSLRSSGWEDAFYILAVKNPPKKKPAAKKIEYHNPEKVPQSKIPAGWRFLRKGEKPKNGDMVKIWACRNFTEPFTFEYVPASVLWTYIVPVESIPNKTTTNTATGIEALVCKDITDRQAVGMKKYGVSVQDNPLSELEWLQHFYEEGIDSLIYVRKLIELKKGKK